MKQIKLVVFIMLIIIVVSETKAQGIEKGETQYGVIFDVDVLRQTNNNQIGGSLGVYGVRALTDNLVFVVEPKYNMKLCTDCQGIFRYVDFPVLLGFQTKSFYFGIGCQYSYNLFTPSVVIEKKTMNYFSGIAEISLFNTNKTVLFGEGFSLILRGGYSFTKVKYLYEDNHVIKTPNDNPYFVEIGGKWNLSKSF